MSILTIGRVGIDIDLRAPQSWEDTPEGVSLGGQIITTTLEACQSLRTELLALQGQTVPVTCSADSTFDGFYTVASVGVGLPVGAHTAFLMEWSAELVRVGVEAQVGWESRLTGSVAMNDHGVTGAASEPYHAPPRGATEYDVRAALPTIIARTGSGGAITVYRDVDRDATPRWSSTPAGFYQGAVKFSSGATQRVRAGLWTPNSPASWTLENELVKVTPHATAAGHFYVAHHDGTAWDTAKMWYLYDTSTFRAWSHVTLLRNDPEEVIVRLTSHTAGAVPNYLDLSLRRGSRFVSGYLSRATASSHYVRRSPDEAGTAFTRGVRAPSNDADGNRYVIGSAKTHTAELTAGGISIASGTVLDFFVGSEIAGSAAVAGDTAAALLNQYLGYVAADDRPVIR